MLPDTDPSQLPPEVASRRLKKLNSILDVAKAMTSQRDVDTLLPLIATEGKRVVEADRMSIFILNRDKNVLWSTVAQGAKEQIVVPADSGIAGAVASTGQIINIRDAYQDPRFNRSIDAQTNYKTTSMLCVPMRGADGTVTGVIQAINAIDGAFDSEDEELLLALGGQAAAAIENALLNEEIEKLFEGFVKASVVAIEARDPTTGGHSERVAALTVALAEATENVPSGTYRGLKFSRTEIKEIRYASLLHDFGKVGVREPVLVKADKLYPQDLEVLKARFEVARKDRQLASYQRRINMLRMGQPLAEVEAEEDERQAKELKELDEMLEFVLTCNKPTVLAQGGFERLTSLGATTFNDSRERPQPLLLPDEVKLLSIPRGSLSDLERREIESHVEHTFKFLTKIPWTKTLKKVPEIAYAHHEKLDGKGYPNQLAAVRIPVQSRMMAISDIYDALTASDRPYKKAVPHQLALDILKREADGGQLDKELFTVFVEAQVPQKALKPSR